MENLLAEQKMLAPNQLFVNRELSWLEFNRRVLLEATDAGTPIFERLKFASIYFNNLDEFFMVRIGALTDQSHAAPNKQDEKTGMTASEQIAAAMVRVREISKTAKRCWQELKLVFAEQAGVDFIVPEEADATENDLITRYFKDSIKLLLSPLVIDKHRPFPFLRNKEQYIVSLLEMRNGKTALGIVPLASLPEYTVFEINGRKKILFVPALVRRFAKKIFAGEKVKETIICRITRNADISVDEAMIDEMEELDFRGVMQNLLKKRRRLAVVRVQVYEQASSNLLNALCAPLEVDPAKCVFEEGMPLDFGFGFSLANKLGLNGVPALNAKTLVPALPFDFKGCAAETIREKDLLLAYPFHSMKPFIDLLEEAADDPRVLSIRITLYRVCQHSKVAMALARAAENGKEVFCVLELRARFDEQNNINYADLLEKAGCTVIYGLPDFKVHAKLCLITYRSEKGTQTIVQVGTGNYNEKTAEIYTDLCLMTADPAIGRDAAKVFNAIGIGIPPKNFESLWVAPNEFLTNVIHEIDEEIAAKQSGDNDAKIVIKVNGLNNIPVMQKLIEASMAGVPVELFIRGICCLRPGINGYTDNIKVKSIVGTFLEHSRIFVFGAGTRQRIFIGSGDLLNRNLVRRVEVFAPLKDDAVKNEVLNILETMRCDNLKAWEMQPDGTYIKPPQDSKMLPECDSHLALYKYFSQKSIKENSKVLTTKNQTSQKKSWFKRVFKFWK